MEKPISVYDLKDGRRLSLYYDMDSENPAKCHDNYSAQEVKAWKQGDVYGFVLEGPEKTCPACLHKSRQNLDSCWGFYGWKWAHESILNNLDKKTAKALKAVGFHA